MWLRRQGARPALPRAPSRVQKPGSLLACLSRLTRGRWCRRSVRIHPDRRISHRRGCVCRNLPNRGRQTGQAPAPGTICWVGQGAARARPPCARGAIPCMIDSEGSAPYRTPSRRRTRPVALRASSCPGSLATPLSCWLSLPSHTSNLQRGHARASTDVDSSCPGSVPLARGQTSSYQDHPGSCRSCKLFPAAGSRRLGHLPSLALTSSGANSLSGRLPGDLDRESKREHSFTSMEYSAHLQPCYLAYAVDDVSWTACPSAISCRRCESPTTSTAPDAPCASSLGASSFGASGLAGASYSCWLGPPGRM